MNRLCLKKRKTDQKVIFAFVILCILLTIMVSSSFSIILDDGVEVSENSPLTYYLNVSYDGVDKMGIVSNDTTIADVRSGTIYVQDRIPDGLIFDGFVTTDDGSIGAVQRDSDVSCSGKVFDDTNEDLVDTGLWNEDRTEYTYHGLHYNENTRTVTFSVKDLQAGCELTVGIKTITPTIDNPNTPEKEVRRDFYNFATAREKTFIATSNTVHVFMGSEFATLYKVRYEFTGDIPEGVLVELLDMEYMPGTNVGVAMPLEIDGYEFSGWSTDDVEVVNGSFIMPEKEVVFKGNYTRSSENKVIYSLANGVIPDGYVLPSEKNYYVGSTVKIDSLKAGDILNGYRFLGWKTEDVIVKDDEFIMPKKDVYLEGKFEEVKYKVSYQFYDTVTPPNAGDLLPATREYKPGSEVILESVIDEPEGYKFLGWYKEDKFIMPDEDIIIYGEWKVQKGLFAPTITIDLINEQDYYRLGDIVNYNIRITNNADYPIKDIVVRMNNEKAEFNNSLIIDDSIEFIGNKLVKIGRMGSKGQDDTIDILASYKVSSDDMGTINNEVEIIGALADNNYELDTSLEYKATVSFKVQSKIRICEEVLNSTKEKEFQVSITDNMNQDIWLNIGSKSCRSLYLEPGEYDFREVVPQEYNLKDISLSDGINVMKISNGDKLQIEEGKNYTLTFVNEYKKKGFFHADGRVENKVVDATKAIIINVADYTKEYDGIVVSDMTYSINGEVDEGMLEITIPVEYKNAGVYNVYPIATWKNPNDENKYNVTINPGKLIINKRNVTFVSGSYSKIYNGTPLTLHNCSVLSGEILPSDRYTCNFTGSQTIVGTSKNYFTIDFEDSTTNQNYNITKNYGDLTVTSIS